ncbi:single-stranded DNA-binding protein [Trueperella bialowiezensis]|uniref:Helix-destabilizing protein n=1 Tax=Trueperella bialowiezensis TaxID=312285 RepID=A0A3S5EVZ3_9ACTO|nr:single-stranded DNA-binding protein [Trueperella bialowiezensis]VEI12743.1 Helix-destabilizing protein [Trueperella bialowiezensis]
MNDTHVTIRGWIGGSPRMFTNTASDGTETYTTIFRVGVTPRHYDRRNGQYTDGVTMWYSIRCYGQTAKNAAMSLSTGNPVIVRGRLVTRLWVDRDGVQRSELTIYADSVGVELSTGLVNYTKRHEIPADLQPGEPGWSSQGQPNEDPGSEPVDDEQFLVRPPELADGEPGAADTAVEDSVLEDGGMEDGGVPDADAKERESELEQMAELVQN